MTLLDAALGYAQLGLRIFPLVWHGHPDDDKIAGTPLVKWRRDATSNEKQIRGWWGRWPEAGIGLACGDDLGDGRFLFVLDLDRHNPAEDGIELFDDLEAENGGVDAGPIVLTAGGGKHLYFTSTTEITNARGTLPAGIDVRGTGGYVVLPPSSHKSGGRHEWEHESELGEVKIPAAPQWLLDIITATPEPSEHSNTSDTGTNTTPGAVDVWAEIDDRPGTLWHRETEWKTLLEADGWRYLRTQSDGTQEWQRPGDDATDGKTGATVNYGGADRLVVHSTNANVPPDSYSKLGYLAAAHHGGDFSAATRAIIEERPPDPPSNVNPVTGEIQHEADGDDWTPIDLAEIARQIQNGEFEPELPEILDVHDSIPLIYPGRSHSIFGTPGGGKTWVALAAVAEVLKSGEWVLLLDWEDSAAGTAQRLVRLGVTIDELSRLDYRSLSTSLVFGWATLVESTLPYRLVVIDSTGEALAAQGVNPNEDGEVAKWMSLVKRLTLRESAPAILLLDHVPKSTENPHGAPIGSQRKLAALTGAAYRCDTLVEPAKGKQGKLKLTVAKDRLGHRAKGSIAAQVEIADTDDGGIALGFALTEAQAAVARGEVFYPTVLMERVSRYVEDNPGATKKQIENDVSGKAAMLRKAIEALVDLGFVRQTDAGGSIGHLHYVEHSYREGDSLDSTGDDPDPVYPVDNSETDDYLVPSSPLVPTSSPTPRDDPFSPTSSPSSPLVPSYQYEGRRDEVDGGEAAHIHTELVPPGEPDPNPVDNSTTPRKSNLL